MRLVSQIQNTDIANMKNQSILFVWVLFSLALWVACGGNEDNGLQSPVIVSPDNFEQLDHCVDVRWYEQSEAEMYLIEIAVDEPFDTVLYTNEVTATAIGGTTSSFVYAVDRADTMYVRMRASNASLETAWSDVIKFYTDTTLTYDCFNPPAPPVTLQEPENFGVLQADSAFVSWYPELDALSYALQVVEDAPVFDLETGSFILNISGISDSYKQVNGLQPGNLYYWRVNVYKNGQPGFWSDPWQFTVE